MSDELSISLKATLANGGTEIEFPNLAARQISVDVTGDRFIHQRQQIGTSEEALNLGDIATGGYFIAINRDDTNYVELRSGTGAVDLVRINAGELACFRISADATAPFAIANTAAVELEFLLVAV